MAGCASIPPRAPPNPPKPTMEAMARRGKQSDAMVKIFADQPWWAAAATLTKATVSQRCPAAYGTKIAAVTARAQTSMAVLRAALADHPRFRSDEESQPPPIEPISADK